jgi:penicillin-binding protein-related factor A (putative recombinase)
MEKNDGKYLEQALQDELSKTIHPLLQWRRLHDSFTAKGKMLPAQPADFFLCFNEKCFHLECKTSKEKNLRLKMFSQYADMRRWDSTGVIGVVIIHFYTVDRLFLMPVNRLEDAPSWKCDVLGTEVMNLEEAVNRIMEGKWS